MEYNRLPKLINKYPQTGNYIATSVNNSSLFGLYSDTNKVDFNLPVLDNISIVPDTKLRTLVAIYEDRNDTTPQYYTSEIYHRDLSASRIDANPYFLEVSFNPNCIVNVYLKEIINSTDAYKEAELKRGLVFSKNNFILYNNSGISSTITNISESNTNTNTSQLTSELNDITSQITKLENEISNVESKIKRKGLFGARAEMDFDGDTIRSTKPFNRNKQIDDIKNQLGSKLLQLKDRKKKIEEDTIAAGVTKIVSKELKQENVKVDKDEFFKKIKNNLEKAPNPKDLIEVNGVFVDCILLVKYIDWVLTEPSINEIENGGVIAAELLLEYEEKQKEVKTDNLDSNKNTTETNPTPAGNVGTGNYFEYQIIRLSIPATLESSKMTFRNSAGEIQSIQTADYGNVGTYCIEENSFNGNYNLYQRTQLAPCNIPINPSGGGGYRGGGSYDYYDNQNRNIDYIDKQRDFQNIR
jgi:hypothetical protein